MSELSNLESPADKEAQDEDFRCSRFSNKTKIWAITIALVLYAQSTSVSASIRYGFLSDSFSRRNIPGRVYGLVEGSIIVGYLAIFLSRGTNYLMKKIDNSRYLLAGVVGSFAVTALLTGLVYLIEHNLTLIVISIIIRIIQGILSYSMSLIMIDYINAQLSNKFDLVNGLTQMGHFTGHGIALSIGCILYNNYGYIVPFIFASSFGIIATVLILVIIPNSRTSISNASGNVLDTKTEPETPSKLSKLVFIPLVATMMVNVNYGVLQVSLTPFLHEMFNKSISYGGVVLAFVSAGMAVGSFSAGVTLQNKILHKYTVMGVGALAVGLGLLITFPPESMTTIFNLAPILAFGGVFLAGFGDPFITIATLRAMYDIQLQQSGMLTPQMATRMTEFWLMGFAGCYYSGSIISGLLMDYLTFSEMAGLLSGFCFLSVLICIGLRVLIKSKTLDDEHKPLIGGH